MSIQKLRHDAFVYESDEQFADQAANEIAANAWLHAGGPATVRVGDVGDRFVCEVSDGGQGFDDPLAGYLPPNPERFTRSGLWIARQLTWRLDLLSSPRGLTVRLWI